MPAHTPGGLPYPLPEDAVTDYPALGQELAEKIETTIGTVRRVVIRGPATREPLEQEAPAPKSEEEATAELAELPATTPAPPTAELLAGRYVPPAGCRALLVECLAGGGGGGTPQTGSTANYAASGGGHGGGYASALIVDPDPAGYDYVVGGGAPAIPGGQNRQQGLNGADTGLGPAGAELVLAKGGHGGQYSDSQLPPAYTGAFGPLAGAIGDVTTPGEVGGFGEMPAANYMIGGRGGRGAGPYGGPGANASYAINSGTVVGTSAGELGGGGAGGCTGGYSGAALAGSAGGPGLLVIWELY